MPPPEGPVRGGGPTSGRSVTDKVLAILGAFESGPATLTLTEIAAIADLPKPTAHRLIGELVEWGALRKDTRGRYRVGRRIWKIGQNAGRELRDTARRHLNDLFELTGETCQLAIRDGDQALIIERVFGRAETLRSTKAGDRFPLHTTAVGLALLAHEPPWIRDAYVSQAVPQPAERRRLSAELTAVRGRVDAATAEEARAGASVAVPVLVDPDHAVAAIGLVTPAADHRRQARHLAALQQTARRMQPEARRWPNTPAIMAAFDPSDS